MIAASDTYKFLFMNFYAINKTIKNALLNF